MEASYEVVCEFLDYAPYMGIQIKTLAGSLAMTVASATFYKVCAVIFKKRKKIEVPLVFEEIKEPNTPAFEVAMGALNKSKPSYNDKTHRLFVSGLAVEFCNEDTNNIAQIIAAPEFTNGIMTGTPLDRLLTAEERVLLKDFAVEVRRQTKDRDLRKANEKAAHDMNLAYYREAQTNTAAHIEITYPKVK